MRTEASGQCAFERGALLAQAPARQLGDERRVRLTRHQRLEHLTSRAASESALRAADLHGATSNGTYPHPMPTSSTDSSVPRRMRPLRARLSTPTSLPSDGRFSSPLVGYAGE